MQKLVTAPHKSKIQPPIFLLTTPCSTVVVHLLQINAAGAIKLFITTRLLLAEAFPIVDPHIEYCQRLVIILRNDAVTHSAVCRTRKYYVSNAIVLVETGAYSKISLICL